MAPMLRRRFRRKRTVSHLARMLTALEHSSRTGRPWVARRERVSLGRAL
jgi:hypothetical protein